VHAAPGNEALPSNLTLVLLTHTMLHWVPSLQAPHDEVYAVQTTSTAGSGPGAREVGFTLSPNGLRAPVANFWPRPNASPTAFRGFLVQGGPDYASPPTSGRLPWLLRAADCRLCSSAAGSHQPSLQL